MNRKIPAICWMIVLVIISGFPGDKVPKVPVWQFDKLVHSIVYFVLSVTLIYAFHRQYQEKQNRFKIVVLVVLFGIFYGGFMELLQHYIFINRSGNWYDFLANSIGTILGVIIYPFVMKLLPKIS